jgi:hypothetical protein
MRPVDLTMESPDQGDDMADTKLPEDTRKTSIGVEFPTTDLPGTDHPNPPKTDQQGIKGMDPKSETGTQGESEPQTKP